MSELIDVSENNVVWIGNDEGKILGIISIAEVIDEYGITYEDDTIKVLEDNGFELDQDFDAETTTLVLDNAKVIFSG